MKCIFRILLSPLSGLYYLIAFVRNVLYDKKIKFSKSYDIPVICVGNVSVGGTGKTPHTELIINTLCDTYRVAMLSRGYRRHSKGFVRATATSTASELGDEPMQIHRKFPQITVACDADRVHGIDMLLADSLVPQVVVLDDAFQHRSVRAGLNIVLTDYHHPIFADCMMPGGRLREPWSRALRRADYVVVSKCPSDLSYEDRIYISERLGWSQDRLFFTSISYGDLMYLDGKECVSPMDAILCVTGIAKPKPFQNYLKTKCLRFESLEFPDHHDFSNKELMYIQQAFEAMPETNKMIVTTEKDAMRLMESQLSQLLRSSVGYIPIIPQFIGNDLLISKIKNYVATNQK